MNVVLNKLSPFYESQILMTQFNFHAGKGCNDSIYVIKQLQEIVSDRKLYTCPLYTNTITVTHAHSNRDFFSHSQEKKKFLYALNLLNI